jgi:hypothetical protein
MEGSPIIPGEGWFLPGIKSTYMMDFSVSASARANTTTPHIIANKNTMQTVEARSFDSEAFWNQDSCALPLSLAVSLGGNC